MSDNGDIVSELVGMVSQNAIAMEIPLGITNCDFNMCNVCRYMLVSYQVYNSYSNVIFIVCYFTKGIKCGQI